MIEADMSNNLGLFYCSPDYLMTIEDFSKHMKIGIQTKGYETFTGNNILLCVGYLGKCMNNTNVNFKVDLTSLVESISSKGIKLIKPYSFDP